MRPSRQNPSRAWQWFMVGVLILLAGVVIVALALFLWVHSYVQGEPFRKLVAQKTSEFLKVEGDYLPFRWSGFSISSEGFIARGRPNAPFTEFRADQIRAEINPRSLFQHAWQIDRLQIQRLQVTLAAPAFPPFQEHPTETSVPPSPLRPQTGRQATLDLRNVVIQEANVKWGGAAAGEISQVRLTLTPDAGGCGIQGTGGRLLQKDWPVLNIKQFTSHYESSQLAVSDAQFRVNDQGNLDATGEVRFDSNPRFQLNLKFSGVPVTPFLPEDWRARLTGELVGDVKVMGPFAPSEAIEASGTVGLAKGRVEALPLLDQIALLTQTKPFRQIALQRASADFTWSTPKLTVTRFAAESEGLFRIDGDALVNQRILDGNFRVGVTPSGLQWLPGTQSKVFTVQEGAYSWTTMRVAGPVEHPKEDLSPRLLAAAKDTVVDGVKSTIEKNAQGVIELLKPLLR